MLIGICIDIIKEDLYTNNGTKLVENVLIYGNRRKNSKWRI